MEFITNIWNWILGFLSPIWLWITDFVSLLTWWSLEFTSSFMIFLVGFIILVFVFLFLWKKIAKRKQDTIKLITQWYDKIFYLLAKHQYADELDKRTIWGSPFMAAIVPIISGENPDYIKQHKLIKENIKKVWIIFKDEIVTQEEWDRMEKLHKKYNLQKNLLIINWWIFTLLVFGLIYVSFIL